MTDTWITKGIPAALAVVGSLAIGIWWFGCGTNTGLKERIPGADRTAETTNGPGGALSWEGRLVRSNGVPAELPGSWPRFRGAELDGVSKDPAPLAKSWPANGPRALWTIEVGEGYAGPAIWKGRVYLMDYDHQAQADAVRCLSLADGREIWRYTYPVKIKRDHGMSRTIPTVTDRWLLALGPKCHLHCLDPITGELRWRLNLLSEYNAELPPWYAGQCPLIDGDKAILAVGGDVLFAAFDVQTGKVAWKSPNPQNWLMTHSSVMPLEFKGRRMYVYCASGGVVGISAVDGAILWEYPDWKISIANVPTPVPVGDGRVFFSGGYNAGCLMLQLQEKDGKIFVEPVFRLKATVFGATQQTPIFYEQHLFGVRPDGQLICLDLAGKIQWQSGSANRFGSGPFLIGQGLIFLMDDSGTLTLAEATTAGYHSLARAKILAGPDCWGPMALAGGRLLVRDLYKLTCLEVGAR